MPAVPFAKMPDEARAWVFGAAEPVLGEDARRLISRVEEFVEGWNAHGQPVVGSFDWRYHRFLIVAADEAATGVSGCSIDSLFRTLSVVEKELGIVILDSSLVWYRDDTGEVRSATRPEFREMVRGGEIDEDAIVFDNTVATVGGLRSGEWERPLQDSWHGRAFPVRR